MIKFLFLLCATCCFNSLFAQDTTTIWVNKANAFYKENLYRDAEIWLIKAIKRSPKNLAIQNQLGKLYIEKLKMPNAGMEILNNVVYNDPNNNEAIEALIINYAKTKKAAEILGIIGGLSAPKKININIVKGKCMYWQQDYLTAISLLEAGIVQVPKSYEGHYFLAQSYIDAGNETKAMPYYEKAILLDTTQSSFLMYDIGTVYYNSANYVKAFEYLNKAMQKGIRQTPAFTEAYSIAALNSGNIKIGKATMDTLIAKRPFDGQLLFTTGDVFYHVKEFNTALTYFNKSLVLNPKNYRALYYIGLCYKKLGNEKLGNNYCDRAIASDPSLKNMRQTSGQAPARFGL